MAEGTIGTARVQVHCTLCGWHGPTLRATRFGLWLLNRCFDLHFVKHAWEARDRG